MARVLARLDPAPNDDQQVHGEYGDLIEEEQHEQVERGEDPENAARQNEQEGKELARPVLDASLNVRVILTQEISTPVSMTTPVRRMSGVLMPSTPKCRLMPRAGNHLYCSMN